MTRAVPILEAFPSHDDAATAKRDDPRLRCLAESKIDNCVDVRAAQRCIPQADIISTIDDENRREEGLDLEEQNENALEEMIEGDN